MGKPCLPGDLGEGEEGQFEQNPFYRTDYFDCLTLVNTVCALALSEKKMIFSKTFWILIIIMAIFLVTKIDFTSPVSTGIFRTQKNQLIKDISSDIKDTEDHPICETAEAIIDRPNWFKHRTLADIKLLKPISDSGARSLLKKPKAFSSRVKLEKSRLPYLSLKKLLDDARRDKLFKQIPNGSII